MTAADVYWAPYLERMAAYVPALHRGLKVCSGRFESLLYIRLQPPLHTVTASITYGYSLCHVRLQVRSGPYDAITEWFNAMDVLVPAYSCRVKGRAATWQQVLAHGVRIGLQPRA